MDYWKECISESFDEHGIKATDEQIECVAGDVEGAHENHGMAHGHDCIPNPLETELKELKASLKKEQSKIHCTTCAGLGRIITPGPYHSADSECWRCHGEGKCIP